MKHNAFRWMLAVLLAALLAGCGAETAVPASAAAKPAGSKQPAALTAAPAEPDSMMEPETVPETENAENAETPRITEQISLEKQCSAGYTTISVHLPKLESDSPDAARINQEIWEMGAPYLEQDPNAILAAGFYTWDATWYGDCVSIVVTEEDPTWGEQYHWCFDFESGKQLTNTQLLERMGADPLALENALRRQVMHTFDAAWDRLGPETDRTQWPYTPEAQKDFRWKQLISVSQPDQLDDLPLLLDTEGSAGVLVRVYYADTRQHRNTRFDLPLDAQPLPPDWEQQVLTEWMAVTAVTQGESYAPADRNESFTLRLEKAEITGTVTVSFIRETYVSPQIQSAAETRTGELNAGAVTRWDGEKSQGWNLTCLSEDGRSRWIISMMEDGSLLMQSTGLKKGSTVWYVFRRTTAWDDIGYTAIPRRLWGTYRAGDESAKGIRWMTFLPDGSCCMSVEWDGWNGILTGTAEGTQGRTEDGTELHFTLTDTDGRPCEFWAILLNDDGSPSGCSLKYRAGEQLFDRDTRPVYWKNDSPDLTLVP